MSLILLVSGTSSAYASSYYELKLTPEQKKQAEEITEEWIRFKKITSKLDESEVQRLFETTGTQTSYNTKKSTTTFDNIVIANTKEEIEILNKQLQYAEQPELPEDTVSVMLQSDDTFVAITETGENIVLPAGFWGAAWQVAKCATHLTLVVIPGGAAMRAIKSLGGIKKTAELLVKAGNAKEFAVIAGGAAAEILGIDGVIENCFQW